MSNISVLPQYQISVGVGVDEDWNLALSVQQSDGTPLDTTGISFEIKVGSIAAFTATGGSSGVILLSVPAAQKADWARGVYSLSIVATDANSVRRAVTAGSTLTVGVARSLTATRLPTSGPGSLVGLVDVLALFGALPNVQNGDAIPASGKPYVNASGFVVIAG